MNKNVILFLTTPDRPERIKIALANFRQLEKLGYDIITLTTTDLLPKYIYEKSKLVIHDYNEHKCSKKEYYNFYKETGLGYFHNHHSGNCKIVMFSDTHFPSLLRNYKTLIYYAASHGYENYFYVEDDHYIHEDDFDVVRNYFNKLDDYDLIVFSFKRYGGIENKEMVVSSYFNFGKLNAMSIVVENFAYTSEEFNLKDKWVHLSFYEYMFGYLIRENSYPNIRILNEEFFEGGVNLVFPNSNINIIYSHNRVDAQSRCGLLYDPVNNINIYYHNSGGLTSPVNIKLFVNDIKSQEITLSPGNWSIWPMNEKDINNSYILIDGKYKKDFSTQVVKDIRYNGEITK